jgi:hypothetical protein
MVSWIIWLYPQLLDPGALSTPRSEQCFTFIRINTFIETIENGSSVLHRTLAITAFLYAFNVSFQQWQSLTSGMPALA